MRTGRVYEKVNSLNVSIRNSEGESEVNHDIITSLVLRTLNFCFSTMSICPLLDQKYHYNQA